MNTLVRTQVRVTVVNKSRQVFAGNLQLKCLSHNDFSLRPVEILSSLIRCRTECATAADLEDKARFAVAETTTTNWDFSMTLVVYNTLTRRKEVFQPFGGSESISADEAAGWGEAAGADVRLRRHGLRPLPSRPRAHLCGVGYGASLPGVPRLPGEVCAELYRRGRQDPQAGA
jgi:hypothetical protein